MGHDQTVIVASEKDSTQAKITSAVHVPHKDAKTADVQETHIEDNWNEADVKVLEGFNASKNVTTNATPSGDGSDEDQ